MGEDYRRTENRIYPRIMFAAPASGSGKTLITCGFLSALKKRGIDALSFKCGPDYIDPLFHAAVTGTPATNLDSFFLGRGKVADLFVRKVREYISSAYLSGKEQVKTEPISVIEGVMGYYDGLAGTSFSAGSYDIADCLDCPVIIILDKEKNISFEKQLKELLERVPQSHIKGVILNRATVEDEKDFSPKACSIGVRCYGYVPDCDEAKIESRHLGLKLPSDDEKFLRKISVFSDIIEETADVDGMISLALGTAGFSQTGYADEKKYEDNIRLPETGAHAPNISVPRSFCGTIAVARDEAFCFQYEDNLDFLRELGYKLTAFSPLRDKALPGGLSAILLCGGYPEVYARELSANQAMLNAVRQAFENVKIMAECGGFMYLHESLEGTDGTVYPMAGCIDARAFKTGRSPRFGYISLYENGNRESKGKSSVKDSEESKGDALIRAHEFHYWDSTAPGTCLLAVKPLSGKSWECYYTGPSLLAGFPHLYYRSGPEFISSFLTVEDELC